MDWLFLCLLAVYLSGTRTLWLTELVLLSFISLPYIKLHKIKALVCGISLIIVFGAIIVNNSDNGMVKSILQSVDEISTNHKFNHEEIVHNYRGYETYRTLYTFNHLTLINKIFGAGCGATVDVRNENLVGLRYVPIMHNGYAYLLIKSGYFGMLLFFCWGVYMFRTIVRIKVNKNSVLHLIKYLSLGIIVMIFVVNSSVWGFVNAFYNVSLFIPGAFVYYTSLKVR